MCVISLGGKLRKNRADLHSRAASLFFISLISLFRCWPNCWKWNHNISKRSDDHKSHENLCLQINARGSHYIQSPLDVNQTFHKILASWLTPTPEATSSPPGLRAPTGLMAPLWPPTVTTFQELNWNLEPRCCTRNHPCQHPCHHRFSIVLTRGKHLLCAGW